MSIADNIKRLRTAENLSQAELGKIAGVTDKAVSTWEAGLKTPRMGAIEKMASHFGVPKSAILDDAPIYTAPTIPAGFEPLPEMTTIPLVGSIACGTPHHRRGKHRSPHRHSRRMAGRLCPDLPR